MQQFLAGMVVEKETFPMSPLGGQTIESFLKFHHLFWSFRPCINGFQYFKLVV